MVKKVHYPDDDNTRRLREVFKDKGFVDALHAAIQSWDERRPALVAPSKVASLDLSPTTAPQPKIFLCYRREDTADITGRIHDVLRDRFGEENILRDVDSVPVGTLWDEEIDRMIQGCDAFVCVLGENWVGAHTKQIVSGKKVGRTKSRKISKKDDPVRVEIASALRADKLVIPALVHGCAMPKAGDLPSDIKKLARIQGADVRQDPHFREDVTKICGAIEHRFRMDG